MSDLQLNQVKVESPDSQYLQLQTRISRSNEKKFICNYMPGCHAAFSRQEHLQRHIRKHTGERPFSCGCGRTFTRLDNLRQHAQTVHSGTEMANITEEQNAIAQATKMRPTPNSPPPRVDGGSDTDPYPRPASKIARHSAPTTREPSLEVSTPPPPQSTPSIPSIPSTLAQDEHAMPTQSPYEAITFAPPILDNPAPPQRQPTFHTGMQTYTPPVYRPPPPMPYPNHHQHHHHHHYYPNNSHAPDVESSVGSQPISSLAKRRTPKSDFVYTGGGGLLNTNRSMNGGDYNSAADDGETMSEYINNGHEPKLFRDNTLEAGDGAVGSGSGGGSSGAGGTERLDPDGLEAMNMLSELAAARRD